MNKSRWIAHERVTDENNINLFCFTYPGGSASSFAIWKKMLDQSINLLPVLYPEREIRKKDKMPETFDLFVEDFINENRELLEKPYAFFGYCGGAVIAYEVAVRVKKLTGKEPVWGLIASSEAPKYLKDSLVGYSSDDDEDSVKNYLKGLGMFDEQILNSDMFMQYYAPLLKADCIMLNTYVEREYEKLGTELYVMYGKEDHTVSKEKTEEWKNVTEKEMVLDIRDGGHFFVEEQKEYVIGLINEKLSGNKVGSN